MSEKMRSGIQGSGSKPRARDLGIDIGIFAPGPADAITDVKGVLVGHETIIKGEGALVPGEGPARTGVTVILPHGGNLFRDKVQAGCHVLNGFGKSTGFHQIRELGTLETPIALTNTLNVGIVADALIEWSCRMSPEIGIGTGTVNPVVGDINDGFLNDIQGRHVKKAHVFAALEAALASGRAGTATLVEGGRTVAPGAPIEPGDPVTSGVPSAPATPAAPAAPVGEGNVGGGTGCSCLGFKGGIGTSSRLLPARLGGWTVGVLVQTNFGGILSINGAPVGRELGVFDFAPRGTAAAGSDLAAGPAGATGPAGTPGDSTPADPGARDGSCMIVIATDAPLDSRQLTRIARRAGLGLARCGFYSSSGSGDFFIAFSNAGHVPHSQSPGALPDAAPPLLSRSIVPDDAMTAIFAASVEAVEEAVVNSLLAAETMTGRDGNTRRALDAERLLPILDRYNSRFWSTRLPPRGAL
jgi:D-aminopeptidase